MNSPRFLVTIVGLVLVSIQAASLPLAPGPRSSPSGFGDVIQNSIEKSLGRSLSESQRNGIRRYSDSVAQSAKPVVFGRDETFLFCVTATLAFVAKAQVGVCSDTSGNPYYIQFAGYGAVFGIAGQVFMFAAEHDSDQPIAPRFIVFSGGATAARAAQTLSMLNKLAKIAPWIGPEAGLFHSFYGNQAGLLAGVNIGKIVGADGSTMIIHDSFSSLIESLMNYQVDLTPEEFEARMQARKVRLGMK